MLTSYSQQRVYKASQYNTSTYNLYVLIDHDKLEKDSNNTIDTEKAIYTLKQLATRHLVLSSSFYYKEYILLCNTNNNPSLYFESFQYTSLTDIIQELLSNTHFNLQSSCLIRPIVLNSKDQKESLLFIFHHIVFDGWSSSIFEKEFIKLYKNEPLVPLDYSYQDYCLWEQEYLKSSRFQRSLDWWKMNFKPDIMMDLPYDSLIPSSSYSLVEMQVIQDLLLIEKWKKYTNNYKLSSFQFFQIMLSLTFWCITSQSVIVLNGITTNRPSLKAEKLIGMFVNTIAYPYTIDPSVTFDEFIKQARKLFYQVITHSQVPYEYISSGNPQVMTTTSLEQSLSSSSSSSRLSCKRVASKFDLSVSVEVTEVITIQWIYREGMFAEDTIQKIGNVFDKVLSLIVPNSKLEEIKESICMSNFFSEYQEIKNKSNS